MAAGPGGHEIRGSYGCTFGLPVSVGGGRGFANMVMVAVEPTYRLWRIILLLAERWLLRMTGSRAANKVRRVAKSVAKTLGSIRALR